jgi:deoxyribonuclease V
MTWPSSAEALAAEQARLAGLAPPPWTPPPRAVRLAACAVVFGRGGRDDLAWAAAAVEEGHRIVASSTRLAPVGAPFQPGRLALREGPILEAAVRGLAILPDVVVVAAAGRDHPRGAGLALQLGAVLGLPTVGVTDDPLVAAGAEPDRAWGARAPLRIGDAVVAYRLRTRGGTRPVVAHAAWRTSPEVAAEVVLGGCALARWPEALRAARRLARELRAAAGSTAR